MLIGTLAFAYHVAFAPQRSRTPPWRWHFKAYVNVVAKMFRKIPLFTELGAGSLAVGIVLAARTKTSVLTGLTDRPLFSLG